MALCGSFRCGCGIAGGSGVSITGSGESGDPFTISVSSSAIQSRVFGTTVTTGAGTGLTERVIGTLTIPAQAVATRQIPSAYWTGTSLSTDSRFEFKIRDTNVSGAIRGSTQQSFFTANSRAGFAIAGATIRDVAAGASATYVATIIRIAGDGNIVQQTGGGLSVVMAPA